MALLLRETKILILFLLLSSLYPFMWAGEPSLSVEIVGVKQGAKSSQYNYTNRQDPVIEFPRIPVSSGNTIGEFVPKNLKLSHGFYVVIRNTSKRPIELRVLMSDLYNSLSFDLIMPNGKSVHIDRNQRSWDKNFPVSWYFSPQASRVISVDFINYPWEGLPSNFPINSIGLSKMKARFTYLQQPELDLRQLFAPASEKRLPIPVPVRYSFESDETEVITQIID